MILSLVVSYFTSVSDEKHVRKYRICYFVERISLYLLRYNTTLSVEYFQVKYQYTNEEITPSDKSFLSSNSVHNVDPSEV